MYPPHDSDTNSIVICSVCHSDITDLVGVYQSPVNFAVVCRQCLSRFTQNDIEMMIGLFFLYGGYFGKLKDRKFSLDKALSSMEMPLNKEDVDEMNQRLMHDALIHGLEPFQFNQKLQLYSEENEELF
jgi:hypothetical protein